MQFAYAIAESSILLPVGGMLRKKKVGEYYSRSCISRICSSKCSGEQAS